MRSTYEINTEAMRKNYMDGNFELNIPGYYTPKNVAEILEFDKDEHGNTWYGVIFDGDAETYLWLAKNVPEEGKQYYGHIEPTKSGKRLRFRSDKLPEGASKPSGGSKPVLDYEPSTNARWAIGMAYRAFNQVMGTPFDGKGDFPFDTVKEHALHLMLMFDQVKNGDKVDINDLLPKTGREQFKEVGEQIKAKRVNEEDL